MTTGIIKKDNGRTNVPSASFSGLADQFFQNNLNRFFEDSFWGFNGVTQQYTVPVNLAETDKEYLLQLVAPGLRKEDFKVHLEGDLLTIACERKAENKNEDKNQRWLRKEYNLQEFTRSFTLDETLDASLISAAYNDGILYLTLPKKKDAQRITRNIEIR